MGLSKLPPSPASGRLGHGVWHILHLYATAEFSQPQPGHGHRARAGGDMGSSASLPKESVRAAVPCMNLAAAAALRSTVVPQLLQHTLRLSFSVVHTEQLHCLRILSVGACAGAGRGVVHTPHATLQFGFTTEHTQLQCLALPASPAHAPSHARTSPALPLPQTPQDQGNLPDASVGVGLAM